MDGSVHVLDRHDRAVRAAREGVRQALNLAARIVGTGETWLTELSTDQLRDLVALDAATAVAE